jgi:hypothetical protein
MANKISDERISFNKDDFIIENIPIPKKTYPLNEDAFIKKKVNINNCKATDETKKKLIEIMDYVFKNTVHINFKDFMKNLYISVEKFQKNIGENPYILYIPHPDITSPYNQKSNYWVSQIVYHMLKRKPFEIISILDIKYYNQNKSFNILLCDDAIFSGTQMSERILRDITHPGSYIDNHMFKIEDKYYYDFNIFIIVPFITEIGRKKIELFSSTTDENKIMKINLFHNYIIKIPKIPHIEHQKPALLYFDHRIPDFMSTYSSLYNRGYESFDIDQMSCMYHPHPPEPAEPMSLIKHCSNDHKKCFKCEPNGGESCPLIPYKNRENKEFVEMLIPSKLLNFIELETSQSLKVLVVCSGEKRRDFNLQLNQNMMTKLHNEFKKNGNYGKIDYIFCDNYDNTGEFPDCLQQKVDIVWFAGCNLICQIISSNDTIKKMFDYLNENGIFLFTEGENYYKKIYKNISETLTLPIDIIMNNPQDFYYMDKDTKKKIIEQIIEQINDLFIKIDENDLIYYKKKKINI